MKLALKIYFDRIVFITLAALFFYALLFCVHGDWMDKSYMVMPAHAGTEDYKGQPALPAVIDESFEASLPGSY